MISLLNSFGGINSHDFKCFEENGKNDIFREISENGC